MRVYHNQILGNTVTYISKIYFEKTRIYPAQMIVYKLLALLDFNSVVTKGRPCTELTYKARKNGPVPEELYVDSEEKYNSYFITKKYTIPNGRVYKRYIAVCEPDMGYLCPSELAFLNEKLNFFIDNKFTSKMASDYSHRNIVAWERAFNNKPNSIIDYALEFDGDIYSKEKSNLSMVEEQFLSYNECRQSTDR